MVGGLADSASDLGPGFAVNIQSDEEWLSALTPGTVEAVGFHPYTFDVSPALMQTDTEALRRWMDANGMSSAPIDVNEVGACDVTPETNPDLSCTPAISFTSANWGTFASNFTEWALCTSALGVESVQPEYWGDTPTADKDDILEFVTGEGTLTPYGQAYLNEAQVLTTTGCPLSNVSAPSVTGTAVVGQTLAASSGSWNSPSGYTLGYQWERCDATGQNCDPISGATSADYQLQSADVGSTLVALVTASNSGGSVSAWSGATSLVTSPPPPPPPAGGSPPSGGDPPPTGTTPPSGGAAPPTLPAVQLQLSHVHAHGSQLSLTVAVTSGSGQVTAVASKGHHRVRLHLTAQKHSHTMLTFGGKLARGRWTVTITCQPASGFSAASPQHRKITISR